MSAVRAAAITAGVCGTLLGSVFTYVVTIEAEASNRAAVRAEMRNECYCGASRTCVFGPGIVGKQSCLTSLDRNEWSRCEPEGSQ